MGNLKKISNTMSLWQQGNMNNFEDMRIQNRILRVY